MTHPQTVHAGVPTSRAADMPDEKRRDLVLEGGGVKGIGLAGAVIEMAAAGYTFPRIAGTSAGAIAAAVIAALNAAKLPLAQMKDIIESCRYANFVDAGRLHAAANLVIHHGMYNAKYLETWLGDALEQIHVTKFGDLRLDDPGADKNLTEAQKYSLVVHTADLTRGRCVRLPWDYPQYGVNEIDDVKIVDAVRASMAIPFFFEPVIVNAPRSGVPGDNEKVTWVDGGLLANFPVEVFDRSDGVPSRWDTVGIKLSAKMTAPSSHETSTLLDESIACLHTVLDNADRYYITPNKADRTIFVDNAGVKTTDFGLTPEARETLFSNGRAAAKKWVDKQ